MKIVTFVLIGCLMFSGTIVRAQQVAPIVVPPDVLVPLLQQEIQTMETRLIALESTVAILDSRTVAVEARVTTIEVKVVTLQNTPSPVMAILSSIGGFFSNPTVIAGVVAIATCHYTGKC